MRVNPLLSPLDARRMLGGISNTTMHDAKKAGLFVSAVPIFGRRVGYPVNEVQAIIDARRAGKNDNEIRSLVDSLHQARRHIA